METEKTTCEKTYYTLQETIHEGMKILLEKLQNHESKFRNNSKDWGMVGDLGRIENVINEINNTIL